MMDDNDDDDDDEDDDDDDEDAGFNRDAPEAQKCSKK